MCPGALTPSRRASKNPPKHLHHDAWRILMHVVKRRELMPLHAADYCKRALARAAASPPDEGVPLDAPPGHSEGGAAKKSRGTSAPNLEGGPLEATPKHGLGSASSATGDPLQPLCAGWAPQQSPSSRKQPSQLYPFPCPYQYDPVVPTPPPQASFGRTTPMLRHRRFG